MTNKQEIKAYEWAMLKLNSWVRDREDLSGMERAALEFAEREMVNALVKARIKYENREKHRPAKR